MKTKKIKEKASSKRVIFNTDIIRTSFFEKIRDHFGNWVELRKNLNTYRSRLERFRSGKISLPEETFFYLLQFIGKKDHTLFLNNIMLKDKNWGQVKGGRVTYRKHKEIFEKGRKIGCKIGERKNKYHFKFDIPLTKELSELIGAFIGDGFTNKYGKACMSQFTGDKVLDREYYLNTLIPSVKEIGPNSNPILIGTNNTLRLKINSKGFHNLLTKRFNFVGGKKAYSVKIPDEIINSNNLSLVNHCLRGIFNTDGYVSFDKREAYKKPYLRIGLKMESKELINQIYNLLIKQGIKATITKDTRVIQINGLYNCKKFLNLIGFSNPRHLNKLNKIYSS